MTSQRTRPEDLAGRWLTRFFIDHLAGERAASPRTIASYRDAIKLLLIWFKTAERIPPEKLRLADIDRPRVLRFLDWLETERGCSTATRNQRLAVIKSFCRYTAVEQPDHLEQVTQVLAIRQKKTPGPQLGHLTADEVKALLAEPGTASGRAVRDTVAAHRGLRHRRPRSRALRPRRRRHPHRQPNDRDDPRQGIQDPVRARHGPNRPAARRLPQTPRPAPRPRRRRGPTVPRTQPLQADQIRDRQAPGPPRPRRPSARPRLGSRTDGHTPHAPAHQSDAPNPGRRQPDLHPRPARPRRHLHHRDLRPRRRRNQTQSDRERLRATHPRRTCRTGPPTRP